jgi:predicted DCC family thiol-disulfide oxidoreductase YuxK
LISRVEPTADGRFWLLWDGQCGLCRRAVAWVRRHDRDGVIRTIPFQEVPTPPMTPELARACGRAIHLIAPDGRVSRAGRAALGVLELLGWRRTACWLARPPLIWLVEIGYRIVADDRPFFARFLFRNE